MQLLKDPFESLQAMKRRTAAISVFRLVLAGVFTVQNIYAFTGRAIADETATSTKGQEEFIEIALTPFWRAEVLLDPVLFVDRDPSSRATGNLLFKPSEVIGVESATREHKFFQEKDFTVNSKKGTVTISEGSKIPVVTLDELYPLMTSDLPKIGRFGGDGTRGIMFGDAAQYHQLQVEAKYKVKPGQWKGPIFEYAGGQLPRIVEKLKKGEPVTIVLCGDSISAGANASLMTKAPPGCPAYGELTALALEKHFGSKVRFINHAVGGWTSGNGLQHAKEQKIGKDSPDLVIIAFGMNDVFQRDAKTYQANVRGIMDTVRADAPNVEFILVSTMLGNPEWGMPMEEFPKYRDALKELCGNGVVLADLTAMWEALLERKNFYDLTGNGVNHPNDFGHCVYAQTILSLLIESPLQGKE